MTHAETRAVPAALLLLALVVAGCGSLGAPVGGLPSRPDNTKAVAPVAVVAEGSGAAGEYRIWAYRTSEGMACIELASTAGSTSTCDPTGRPPVSGSGMNRSAEGIVVWANTGDVSARTAIVHDANGASLNVALIDGGPTMPGVRIAVANFGPTASPIQIDFLDAAGSKVDAVRLR